MGEFLKIMRAFVRVFLILWKISEKFTFPIECGKASVENPHHRESESAH